MTTKDQTPEVQIAELQARITQQQAQIQRLWDLVRYARHDLYQAELISDDGVSYVGDWCCEPTVKLTSWRKWARNAEVVTVAGEAGE